ncbi:MAG TPA: DNA-primase RepB domain-containing protein [Bryobacteraceae bacterium]|nr:DNA-primase RepB domain-containing protein [Bryobacteraceae bacterium]
MDGCSIDPSRHGSIFLRIRNREGCDVYLHPYAEERNPGYVLVDLDGTNPAVLETMRTQGHDPCVVLQTSPGNLQAWVRVSAVPIEPAAASQIRRQLAHLYGGDLASTDWCHLGRLAGFTNRKPQRRNGDSASPWVRVLHAGAALLEAAEHSLRSDSSLLRAPHISRRAPARGKAPGTDWLAHPTAVCVAANITVAPGCERSMYTGS